MPRASWELFLSMVLCQANGTGRLKQCQASKRPSFHEDPLFTPVTCLTAAPLSCLTTQTSLELKKNLPIYHPAFIFHFPPRHLLFPTFFLNYSNHPTLSCKLSSSFLQRWFLASLPCYNVPFGRHWESPLWVVKWVWGHAVALGFSPLPLPLSIIHSILPLTFKYFPSAY